MDETPHMLVFEQVVWGPDGAPLIADLSFTLRQGELVVVLGPNGAGKSSLMKLACGLVTPQSGHVLLSGVPPAAYGDQERAKRLGYLPQSRGLAWPNRVEDVVALGRYAHGGGMGMMGGRDREVVERALTACNIGHLRHRSMLTLSGGEQTRVHCARLFAAQTPLLLADEPITALDPHHQHRIMQLIKSYVADGHGALVVLHDLDIAARYADRLIWMFDGRIVADGTVAETLTRDNVARVFDMDSHIDVSAAAPRVHLHGPRDRGQT
ncbi:MAG: ABC transporter ATP-binding protein [Parvibaculales bacterium]